jgi:hypothetical protein
MSLGDTFENDLMKLIMNATAIANIADNAASSPLTVLEVAIHTSGVGDGSSQTTSEATYTGYSGTGRIPVNRNSGGWTVSANQAVNTGAITFGACTAGSNTIHSVTIGTAHSGAGKIIVWGDLTADLSVSAGITPSFAASQLTFTLE